MTINRYGPGEGYDGQVLTIDDGPFGGCGVRYRPGSSTPISIGADSGDWGIYAMTTAEARAVAQTLIDLADREEQA